MRSKTLLFPTFLISLWLIASSFLLMGVEDEELIKKKTAEYEAAINRRDPKALSAIWAEDAFYIDPVSGDEVKGRKEIEQMYRSAFEEHKNGRLKIHVNSISFPSKTEAVETGKAVFSVEGQEPIYSAFRAFFAKRGGDWLLTRMREVSIAAAPSENEHLKQLQWLVGDWVDEDQDSKIETRAEWDKYKNFLTQHFQVSVEGNIVLEGKEIIGWDPVRKEIKSWVFDSDGGYGEGTWKKQGASWFVEAKQTLADGSLASSVNVYTPIDQNSYRWESTGREVGGALLPNLGPVTVVRKKG